MTLADYNIQKESTVFMNFRLHGGAALKRPKVKQASMVAKDSDIEMVKAVFKVTAFNAEAWLRSLSKENIAKYAGILAH